MKERTKELLLVYSFLLRDLPAIFIAAYPQLAALNVMHLRSPESAILSAVIFNALIIVALVPLALRGEAAYRQAYGPGPVPADAVESSAPGLDPDISLANALRQAPAVAAARHLKPAQVEAIMNRLAAHQFLGFIGTDHVNVLRLNLALETLAQGSLAAR